MKRHLFFIACCISLTLYGQTNSSFEERILANSMAVTSIDLSNLPTASSSTNEMTYTAIPDANFEAALVALGIDTVPNDGQVLTADIQGVTSLDLSSQNISDLTGINDFVALETLRLQYNNLTSLDVSNLVNLRVLWAANGNVFSSIDVSNNILLEDLRLRQYTGTSIDLSANTVLTRFTCDSCDLVTVDTSNNSNLSYLDLWNSDITSLDLTANVNLATLDVYSTKLIALDVSANTVLTNLIANDITTLTSLNVQNGNNININTFNVTGSTGLSCIIVDDAAYSTTNWTNIDAGMFFSTGDCRYTLIPDATFEAELESLGYDDISGDGQVPTALIEVVTNLNLDNKGINDATGIEDFTALTSLNLRRNNLTTLNISQNVLLESLNVAQNNLAAIDLSSNTSLDTINIFGNNLTTLDISNNTALEILNVQSNTGLTSLDTSNNLVLKQLSIYITDIAALDVSNNTELRILYAYNTPLSAIDVSNNPALQQLRVNYTNITALDVSNNPNITSLRVNNTSIQTLDLSNQSTLTVLYAHDTSLSFLNVQNGNNTNVGTFRAENNPNLTCINVDDTAYSTTNWTDIDAGMYFTTNGCRYTQIPDSDFETELEALGIDDITNDGQIPTEQIETITVLDITDEGVADLTGIEDFIALEELKANGNNLTSLDISNSPALKVLWLTGGTNNFSTIDVSNNPLLEDFRIQYTGTSIDIANNTALEEFECTNCGLTSLNTDTNLDLRLLELDNSPVASLDLSFNSALRTLRVDNTNLVELDVSNNSSFNNLSANNITTLTTLNVQNGNNTAISTATFQVTGNPLLTCITVDDAAYSTTNWTNIDSGMFFSSTDCRYTQIPDANFEAALESLGYDDISGDGQVPTGLIEVVTVLNVNNQGITDLTGIEDFIALRQLNVNGNSLTALNVSNNTALRVLEATNGNVFNTLDLSANVALEEIKLSNFSGTSIDITNNTALVNFGCTDCNLLTLDTSANTGLEELDLAGSSVTSLDLSNNVVLLILQIDNTDVTSIDLSNNVAFRILIANNIATLTSLNIQNGTNTSVLGFETVGTPVACVLVDDAAYSTANWTDIDAVTLFSDTNCNYTAIPDANFEAELFALGYDDVSGDGQVPTRFIETVTTLDVNNKNISDVTGIEDFTALVTLDCSDNTLTALDISNSLLLESLNCEDNMLSALDISNNTLLKNLFAESNQIASIDISQNTSLKTIDIGKNPIPSLDVTNNPLITKLECNETNITSLNITNLTQLDFLEAHNNAISTLDLSQNTILRFANLLNTNLSTLDVSANTGLTTLWLNNTPLTTLDLTTNTLLESLRTWETNITELDLTNQTALIAFWGQNGALEKLNIRSGTNTSLSTFDVRNNPNLACVLVDDVAYSTINWTLVDATISFSSTYCDYTAIPDTNFEAALNVLGYDDTAADGQVPTELIEVVTSLDVSNQNIADLTGIADFAALIDLNVDTNSLTSLDLSNNGNLQTLNFDNNIVSTINLGTISGLTSIEGRYNQLTTIDLSNNTNLTFINLRNNLLSSINISNNPLLETITVRGNASLTNLDLNNKPNLKSLFLQDSGLTALDVSQNPLLEKIVIERVNFNSIDVSNLPNLFELRITDNSFTELDVSNNPALVKLVCDNNNLTYLNLKNGNNTNMPNADFIATGNPNLTCILVDDAVWSAANWTNIDVTASFNDTYCRYTAIPDANFEAALEALGYDDISGDGQVPTALIEVVTELLVGDEGISNLTGIQDFAALERLQCHSNNIQNLDLRGNTLLEYIKCNDNNMDVLNLEGLQYFEELVGYGNDFIAFDFSNNPKLQRVSLFNNQLTELDLSQNPDVVFVRLDSNQLTSLNIQNGTNTNITMFNIRFNSNLTCVIVDDAAYSTTNWTDIDSGVIFNEVDCRYTAIPDANFEAELEALGYDDISGDGQVPTALIEGITSLAVPNKGINDLTGIQDFVALTSLNCRLNNLTALDVTQNVLLSTLTADNNSIIAINLSNNIDLAILNLAGSNLTTIDVSNNTELRKLFVQGNGGLTNIDISNNVKLVEFRTNSTNIASLDLSVHPDLELLESQGSPIASIDLSNNPLLENLRLENTNITALDVTNNPNITSLRVNDTAIETLDLSNQTALQTLYAHDTSLRSLNVQNGNNTNVTTFRAENNPNLSCILVDDAAYSTTNWTDVDTGLVFSNTYCIYTAIPDANFEARLEALGYDDISGDGQVPTALIEVVTTLDINSQSIADITGIEAFTALEELSAALNTFTSLDLSNNTALRILVTKFTPIASLNISANTQLDQLVCSFNDLSSLDVSANTALTYLECNNNSIASLDVSTNTALLDLRCGNNGLTNIDLTNNTLLTTFWCDNNAITTLDLSLQTALTSFIANDNNLTALNLQNGNNINITNFVATNNPALNCIVVDDEAYSTANWTGIDATAYFTDVDCRYTAIPNANFEAALDALGYDDVSGDGQVPTRLIEVVGTLDVSDKNISDLTGIEDFAALTNLRCNNNSIQNLDLSQNTLLNYIKCDDNNMDTINFGSNANFEELIGYGNDFTTIDLSNLPGLRRISLFNCELTALDLSNNPALTFIRLDNNNLTSLNVQNGNNTNVTLFNTTLNTNLSCILVDDAAYSTTNWTNKDAQTSYNETSCDFVVVDIDVFLQGALINPNVGEETLMRDDLRMDDGSYGPTSPYGDGATISEAIGLNDTGNNATVDWIWVELRDAGSPTTVIAGQSGILQRDGDIVDTSDEGKELTFDNVPAGDYFIVIKHRNHLSIMSANAITLKQVTTTVDFTDATNQITYGSNAQTTFGMPSDTVAMWAGNVNGDNVVQYSGVSPDTPDILSTVLNDAGNFLNFPTYVVSGYNSDDVNLDGNTQYSGTNPDTPFILQNVLAHPGNFLNFSTYQIIEQLPENE